MSPRLTGMGARDAPFTAFATREATGLLRLAVAFGVDGHRAEDVVQTALERLYVRWDRIGDPLSYARQVVVNSTRDSWRHRTRHPESPLSAAPEGIAADATDAVGTRDALLAAVATLPRGQRTAVLLRHWLDLSEAETAAVMGVSTGTVKSQTSRALARLSLLLDDAESSTRGRTP